MITSAVAGTALRTLGRAILPYVLVGLVAAVGAAYQVGFSRGKSSALSRLQDAQLEAAYDDLDRATEKAIIDRQLAEESVTERERIKQEKKDVVEDSKDLSGLECTLPDDWMQWLRGEDQPISSTQGRLNE